MGAPEVIAAPSKSYVAINSYKSDRSLPPTLCDLGRVSSIAAAVTLSRTSNCIIRNNVAQSVRSLPHKKRPISEVMDCSNSNSRQKNAPTEISTTNAHKKKKYTIISQSSTSALAIQTPVKTNLDRNHDTDPQAKMMKLESTETSSMVSSLDVCAANNPNINSVAYLQRNLNTQLSTSQSTNSPLQKLFLQPVQLRSQETQAHSHIQRNQPVRSHTQNTNQLPSQQTVQLPAPGMEQFPAHHSLPIGMQLQQQNQQLRNENVQLQKQLSLFRQLIKNPQRLNRVITRLEQRVH